MANMYSGYGQPPDRCTPPPPPPVAQTVTGLPCPLPAEFMWNGAETTLSAFISGVKDQVPGAVYTANCLFTAPAGSIFPSLVVSAISEAPPNIGVISPCPTTFPIMFAGARCYTILDLKTAVEQYYNVTTCYDTEACTLTRTSGLCELPAIIPIENDCACILVGGVVSNIDGTPQFRLVSAPSSALPFTSLTTFNDISGTLISLIRPTTGYRCGINFNVPVVTGGIVVGYGAAV